MNDIISKSKFLSLLLRHKPEKINLVLDKHGWADILFITENSNISLKELDFIVTNNDKQRFEISADNEKIRAVQGHSIKSLNIEMEKCIPPGELYHGTKQNFLDDIMKKGILPMNRQHVHMTTDLKTAKETADRRKGESVILKIDSCQMSAKEHKFYKAANGVWLTKFVNPEFISIYKK